MRLTLDEYCKHFKMSKEMLHSKLKAKKINYIIEDATTYIIVTRSSLNRDKLEELDTLKKQEIENSKTQTVAETNSVTKPNSVAKPKTTVATVISLYQRENDQLKEKINQLENKIDKLIDDKEQMLRDERDKIEEIYTSKDAQLKNILELVNAKMIQDRQKVHEIESFNHNQTSEIVEETKIIELKEYLKSLGLNSSTRKAIKKRFLNAYDRDIRIILQNGKLFLDFTKYDYSDLLAY